MYLKTVDTKKDIKPVWLAVIAAFAVIFIILVDAKGHVGVAEQLLFLASQVVYVLLPGFALLMLVKPETDMAKALIISICGHRHSYRRVFPLYSLGLKDNMLVCMSAVSALAVFALYKKRRQ
jgi:hypothetical protein